MPVVALLGAGASVGAGVPASVTMTKAIVKELEGQRGPCDGAARALNFAIGQLIAHDTAHGGSAFGGIDVERLFGAVQMLAEREVLEIAPFVSAWNPAIGSFGERIRFPLSFRSDFERALKSTGSLQFERVFKEAVLSQIPNQNENVFPQLQERMTLALRNLVKVDPIRISYLAPLLSLWSNVDGMSIVTLNYDRSIEELALRAGTTLTTGIASWTGGLGWTWDDNTPSLRLLKLHGSIDWSFQNVYPDLGMLREPKVRVGEEQPNELPVVAFGHRGKLRPEGPFMAMLRAFEEMLSHANGLLIVGYSCRDEHVNISIRRWLNDDRARRVIVIDPNFYPERRDWRDDFRSELRTALDGTVSSSGKNREARLRVVSGEAGAGLSEVLGAGPPLEPRTGDPA